MSDPLQQRPLWAPWRIEYITGPKGEGCIFCEAASSSADAEHHVVERGERSVMMMNAFPYAPGHLMIAPVRHVGNLEDVADDEMADGTHVISQALDAARDVLIEALRKRA